MFLKQEYWIIINSRSRLRHTVRSALSLKTVWMMSFLTFRSKPLFDILVTVDLTFHRNSPQFFFPEINHNSVFNS